VLVTNPPYGVRIGEQEELATLYPKIGEVLKKNFAGWNAYFLTTDLRLPKLMRLAPSRKTPLYNGALECRLFEFKMVAGSNRKIAKGEG
jgi:putative N6-adenine-specific DNA methylase